MTFVDIFRLIVLFGMLCWAAYTDVKDGRIPNQLSLTGIALGLILGLSAGGWDGLRLGLMGLLAGGAPLMLLYLIGLSIRKPLMGAGDVKLMAAIGAFVGPVGALWSMYYGIWIAALAAVAMLLYSFARRRPRPKTVALGACLSLGAILWVLQYGPYLFRTPEV
jgi:prepilin peptidase CpaA